MQQKTFDLNSLNAVNGFSIVPGMGRIALGVSVSTAGDINGDGLSDLLLGAAPVGVGASYVIFGSLGGFGSTFNLTSLNGTNGFTIPGVAVFDRLGSSVSTAGDFNGDGLSDLVLGAVGTNSSTGASYVIFGSRKQFESIFNLTTLNGTNGFSVPGIAANGQLGYQVSTAGDINGDGLSDFVLGAFAANNGTAYVIFGSHEKFGSTFDLTTLNGRNGFSVPGIATSGQLGYQVSTAGDINGDGLSDLVLGVLYANSNFGASYVIFGSRGGFGSIFNLTNLNGTNGFTVRGTTQGGYLGSSVTAAGDINGDGLNDLVLGAAAGINASAGASYVIFGSRGGFASSFNLTTLNGTNGFIVPGIAARNGVGFLVSTVGDINGDGISDIALGTPYVNNNTGVLYVIFGSQEGFGSVFNLTNLNGMNGFTVSGIASGDSLGGSVSTAGDVNGDGIDDLVLGAYAANAYAGVAYVIFGGFSSIIWKKNELTITQGQTVVLTSENLAIFALLPANLVNSLAFTVTQIQGGKFTLINNSNVAILNFTQSQVQSGQVQFTSDRSAPVAYRVGLYNVTDGRLVLPFIPSTITFTNNPPIVINPPLNQILIHDQPFHFTFLANQIFNDTDEDPLTFFATSKDAAPLPSWIQFTTQNNRLTFSGTPLPLLLGTSEFSLFAADPLNATASTGFNVTFINHIPEVINSPATQVINVNEPFSFKLAADKIFTDVDGDSLSYSAQLRNGSVLPTWMNFDASQPNQLAFSGTAPSAGGTQVSLFAKDPINANVSTEFEILAVPSNGTVVNTVAANTAQIVGSVVGGVLGLGVILGIGFGLGFWKKNKDSRSSEQFADCIRTALNLKEVDNFDHQTGQKYLTFVHELEKDLQAAGTNPSTMRPGELRKLANDVAVAARNKITPARNCFGQSAITVADLNDNLQGLLIEVQMLRSGGSPEYMLWPQ
jgi:hypothetical protein